MGVKDETPSMGWIEDPFECFKDAWKRFSNDQTIREVLPFRSVPPRRSGDFLVLRLSRLSGYFRSTSRDLSFDIFPY